MAAKGYVFFTMSSEAKGHLQKERPHWLPQIEGVTTELLAGPYDGVFTVEAPDTDGLARKLVELVANSQAVRTTVSLVVLRDYKEHEGHPQSTSKE